MKVWKWQYWLRKWVAICLNYDMWIFAYFSAKSQKLESRNYSSSSHSSSSSYPPRPSLSAMLFFCANRQSSDPVYASNEGDGIILMINRYHPDDQPVSSGWSSGWWSTGISLMTARYHPDDQLVSSWWSSGIILMISSRRSTGIILMIIWYHPGDQPVSSWWYNPDDQPVSYWCWFGIIKMMVR